MIYATIKQNTINGIRIKFHVMVCAESSPDCHTRVLIPPISTNISRKIISPIRPAGNTAVSKGKCRLRIRK
jgi:hypothetical protein